MKRLILPAVLTLTALGVASSIPFMQRVSLGACWLLIFLGGLAGRATLDQLLARPPWSVWPMRFAALAVAICLAGFGHWITWAFFLPILVATLLAPTEPRGTTAGGAS